MAAGAAIGEELLGAMGGAEAAGGSAAMGEQIAGLAGKLGGGGSSGGRGARPFWQGAGREALGGTPWGFDRTTYTPRAHGSGGAAQRLGGMVGQGAMNALSGPLTSGSIVPSSMSIRTSPVPGEGPSAGGVTAPVPNSPQPPSPLKAAAAMPVRTQKSDLYNGVSPGVRFLQPVSSNSHDRAGVTGRNESFGYASGVTTENTSSTIDGAGIPSWNATGVGSMTFSPLYQPKAKEPVEA